MRRKRNCNYFNFIGHITVEGEECIMKTDGKTIFTVDSKGNHREYTKLPNDEFQKKGDIKDFRIKFVKKGVI
jgi:hypothetical protein